MGNRNLSFPLTITANFEKQQKQQTFFVFLTLHQ